MTAAEQQRLRRSPDERPRRRWLQIGRYLLAVLPFWWLARTIDFESVAPLLVSVRGWMFAASLASFGVSLLIATARWSVLMRAYAVSARPPVTTLLRHSLVGLYFNALPSGVAGDALRAYRVREACGGLPRSLTVLFTERVCGIAGLLAIATVAVLWRRVAEALPTASPNAAAGLISPLLVGAALLVLTTLMVFFGPAIARRAVAPLSQTRLGARLYALLHDIPAPSYLPSLGLALVLSLLNQGFAALAMAALVSGITDSAPLALVFAAMPPIMLLTSVQLTPAGIGQREYLYVSFLRPVGITGEQAVAAAMLHLAASAVILGVGGLVYMAERTRRNSGDRQDEGSEVDPNV